MQTHNTPLVSIVIPVYNLESYVETFVNSLKAQTYPHFEAIIINDGSTDNSLDKIHQYTRDDSRFVVISTDNQGVSLARKTGIEQSKGYYITFLDADDTVMPKIIEKLVGAANDSYDIVCCNIKRLCSTYEATIRERHTANMSGVEFLEAILRDKIFGYNCAKLYKRELFRGVTYHPLRLSEDSLLNIQIGCLMPKVKFIDYIGYVYVQRPGSANHTPFDYDYMVLFSATVEEELLKHNDKLKGRAEFLALLNKLRWYMVYINKSHNRWSGDSEFATQITELRDRYRLELKNYYSPYMLVLLAVNRYQIMRPLIIIMITIKRWGNSLKRRMSR